MRPINLNFDRATHVSLIQNEKKKNNGEHKRREFINQCYRLIYIRLEIYLQDLLTKHSVLLAEFPIVYFHFPQWKMYFLIH